MDSSRVRKKPVRYAGGDIEVHEGDVVEYKSMLFWRGWKRGYVSYVPGISNVHQEMEFGGIEDVGIAGIDGTFRGVLVDPETRKVKKTVRFISRGDATGLLRPEDIAPEDW